MKYLLAIVLSSWGVSLWAQAPVPLIGQPTEVWSWKVYKDGTGYSLWRNGLQVGWWSVERQQYKSWDRSSRTWSDWVEQAPIDPPKDAMRVNTVVENFGVNLDKLKDCPKPVYRIDGRVVGRSAAQAAIEAGLPIDKHLERLTIFGPVSERKKIRDALATAPELAEFRDKILVQDYPNDHWIVMDRGFQTTPSDVTIYFQKPGGEVIDRWTGYEGAGRLGDRIRNRGKTSPKVLPNFFPWLGLGVGVPWSAWAVGGIALAGWFWTRRKERSDGVLSR